MELSPSLLVLRIRHLQASLRRLKYDLSESVTFRFIAALGQKMGQDDISNMAASIAYYGILSLFPLLLALMAIFGLFLPSESVQRQLIYFFSQYLQGSLSFLQSSITDIIRFRSAFGVVGILGLIWSGTGIFYSVTHAINRAWDIKHRHPFYIRKPREIAMVLGTGILFLLSMATSGLLTSMEGLGLPFSNILANIGTGIIAFVFSLTIFVLIHKLAPIIWVSWRHVWPGALLSAVLFELAKNIFVFYLNHFNHYDKIYGSIASIIALLIWIYYSSFILLLGAEFSSMLFRLRREGDSFDKPSEKVDIIKQL